MYLKVIKKQAQILEDITLKYFNGAFSAHHNVFQELESTLDISVFTPPMLLGLEKLLAIFFLGQVVSLPTLHSILSKFGVTNGKQILYKKICNKLHISTICSFFSTLFETYIHQELKARVAKLEQISHYVGGRL